MVNLKLELALAKTIVASDMATNAVAGEQVIIFVSQDGNFVFLPASQ